MSIDTEPTAPELLEHAPLPPVELVELQQAGADPSELHRWSRVSAAASRIGKKAAIGAGVAVAAAIPAAGVAAVAVEVAPPAHVRLADQTFKVDLDVNKNYTDIDGMFNMQNHKSYGGLPVGANVTGNLLALFFPASEQDKQAAKQLSQDPDPQIAKVKQAGRNQAIRWGGGAFGATLAVQAAIGGGLYYQRRKFKTGSPEYQQYAHQHNRDLRLAGTVAAIAVVGSIMTADAFILATPDHHRVHPSAFFKGTPLAGVEDTAGATDRAGRAIAGMYDPAVGEFFDRAALDMETAINSRPDLTERKAGTTRFLQGDDIQFVPGAARMYGTVAKLVAADAMLYTGDWTNTDSDFEALVVDDPQYYSGYIDMLDVDALHDGRATHAALAAHSNITVGDNETIEYKGLRILPLNDPRQSTTDGLDIISMLHGQKYILRDPNVSVEQFIKHATDEVCSTQPDALAIHDNKLAKSIIEQAQDRGCALPLVFDARSFEALGLQQYVTAEGEQTLEFTNGSTGGHADTSFDTGIIQGSANQTVIDIDPDQKTVTYTSITLNPDGSVDIGQPVTRVWQAAGESSAHQGSHRSGVSVLSKEPH